MRAVQDCQLSSDEEEVTVSPLRKSRNYLTQRDNEVEVVDEEIIREEVPQVAPAPRTSGMRPLDDLTMTKQVSSDCERVIEAIKARGVCHIPHLLAMGIGLFESDVPGSRPLADTDTDTDGVWKHLPKTSLPKVPDLKLEMKRRAKRLGLKKLRKNTAPRADCIAWLKQNPVTETLDVQYVRKLEKELWEMCVAASIEFQTQQKEKLSTSNWNTSHPWLRLYGCMTHDEAFESLRNHDRVMDRDELDARNNENRPETLWEVVTRLYNDNEVVITTPALPDLHADFATVLELKYEDMPGGQITVEEAKRRGTEAKAKLTQVRHLPKHSR